MTFLKAYWFSAALLLVLALVWAQKKSLTSIQVSKINDYFKKADKDRSGGLTKREMVKAAKQRGPKLREHLKVCAVCTFKPLQLTHLIKNFRR